MTSADGPNPSPAADTERLDWLQANRSSTLFWSTDCNAHVIGIRAGLQGASITTSATHKTDIRAAIDAARAGGEG